MGYGFQIVNDIDANLVKIDENSPQMVLYASGSGVTGATMPPYIMSSLGYQRIPHNDTYIAYSRAILAFRVLTPGAMLTPTPVAVNGAYYMVVFNANVSNVAYEWRLYLVASHFAKATSGYGIQVVDANNLLVYSSAYRPLNLLTCPTVTISDGLVVSHGAVPYGNPWLVIPDTLWDDQVYEPGAGVYRYYTWGVSMGTNAWTFGRYLRLTGASGTPRTLVGQNKRVFIGYDL